MIENWEQYKDLEYYPDRVCGCGCGGRIKVKPWHKYLGIPEYIRGHHIRVDNPMKNPIIAKKSALAQMGPRLSMVGKKNPMKRPEIAKRNALAQMGPRPSMCGDKNPMKRPEVREKFRGENSPMYGRKGKNHPAYGRIPSKEAIENHRRAAKKRWEDPEYRRKRREITEQFWQDPERKGKQLTSMFKGRNLRPNKPEKFLAKLLQRLFPNQWKYVGDGKCNIVGKNPDFINTNGQKKLIEHFGIYWHGEKKTGIPNEQHEQQRIGLFAEQGYQTLIIWEYELEDVERLIKKLTKFCGV